MADTTPTLREAAQQAMEALVHMTGVLNSAGWATGHADAAVKALRAALAEQAAGQASEAENGDVLWLWKNGDHFLAFKHLYPCYSPGGDPMVLGKPFGRAEFRASHDRSAPAAEQAEPVEVTPEMLKAGAAEWLKYGEYEAQFPLAQGFDKLPRHLQVSLSRATHVYRAMRAAAPPAPARQEPLFLLHTGQIDSGGEQDEWDIEANSWVSVEEFCHAHPGQTIGLHPQPLPAAQITAAPAEGGA